MTTTRTRTTYSAVETRARSTYRYHPGQTTPHAPTHPARVFPWWLWAVAPLGTVCVVGALLMVV